VAGTPVANAKRRSFCVAVQFPALRFSRRPSEHYVRAQMR